MELHKHFLVLSLALAFGFASNAQAEIRKEDQVKTAIIYNLARFSEWPSEIVTEEVVVFLICVAAKGEIQEALFELEGKTIAGHPVEVIPKIKPAADYSDCDILYVSAKFRTNLDLDDLAKKGILTIGDDAAFLSAGGGIAIVSKNNKLGFSINQTAMSVANIKPSSKILRLSTEVR